MKEQTRITYEEMIVEGIANAWYPIREFHLSFGRIEKFFDYVNEIADYYEEAVIPLASTIDKEELKNAIRSYPTLNKIVRQLTINVPYAFLTPFSQAKSMDYAKTVEFSQTDAKSPYRIYPDKKKIVLNPHFYDYLRSNKTILEGFIFKALIDFLEERNPGVPGINKKLFPPQTRKLDGAKKLWKAYMNNHVLEDLFSKETMNGKAFAVEHFVPWSFVAHDNLWNLIPLTPSENSRKSNRIVTNTQTIERFSKEQFAFYCFLQNEKGTENALQQYDNLFHQRKIENKFLFTKLLTQEITSLSNKAILTGFREF